MFLGTLHHQMPLLNRLTRLPTEDRQVGVVQVEPELQGVVGDPTAAAKQEENLVEHGVKV